MRLRAVSTDFIPAERSSFKQTFLFEAGGMLVLVDGASVGCVAGGCSADIVLFRLALGWGSL